MLDKKTIGTSIGGTGALLATGKIVLSKRRGQSCHLPVVDWVEKQYFSSAYEESMETSECEKLDGVLLCVLFLFISNVSFGH